MGGSGEAGQHGDRGMAQVASYSPCIIRFLRLYHKQQAWHLARSPKKKPRLKLGAESRAQ